MTSAVLERPAVLLEPLALFDLPLPAVALAVPLTVVSAPRPAGPDRSDCPARLHGSASAYVHYKCRCPDALAAKSRYSKRQRNGKLDPAFVDATGTHRRIRALHAIWHSAADIAAAADMTPYAVNQLPQRDRVTHENAEKIKRAYESLRHTKGTFERAARGRNFIPPSMWDDAEIDDPNADPLPAVEPDPFYVDEVRLERAMKGNREAVAEFSPAEKDYFVEAYLEAGGTLTALTRAFKCSGTAGKWLVKRMLGLQLLDLIKERQVAGEDWSDLCTVMVAVGAGYIVWDEEATARQVRNLALKPANFFDTSMDVSFCVAEAAA